MTRAEICLDSHILQVQMRVTDDILMIILNVTPPYWRSVYLQVETLTGLRGVLLICCGEGNKLYEVLILLIWAYKASQ